MKGSTDSLSASNRHKDIPGQYGITSSSASNGRPESQLCLYTATLPSQIYNLLNGEWWIGDEKKIDFNIGDL